ncbi:hypothetical protein [Streptomyces sp. NPDC101145]|uniref:hypothetical protein n=1 Tax=Streptomyces sp. NPDC101145 TaxID=3366112 RepID=UPI00381C1835
MAKPTTTHPTKAAHMLQVQLIDPNGYTVPTATRFVDYEVQVPAAANELLTIDAPQHAAQWADFGYDARSYTTRTRLAPQRAATIEDIVKRLTDTGYEWTAITALGWGMGNAQLGHTEAVAAAENAGLVRTKTEDAKTFVQLVEQPTAHAPDETVEPPATYGNRKVRHALTAFARTSSARRRLIAVCAADYLSQVDRERLPRGYDQPIADDRRNRADAYRMRRGDTLARLLGLAVRPDDADLPDVARAVLAAAEAPVRRLTALAATTGQPLFVAISHLIGALRTAA